MLANAYKVPLVKRNEKCMSNWKEQIDILLEVSNFYVSTKNQTTLKKISEYYTEEAAYVIPR